jgi:hypothetical protein
MPNLFSVDLSHHLQARRGGFTPVALATEYIPADKIKEQSRKVSSSL